VNKSAKEQMRWNFQQWYGEIVCKQLEDKVQEAVDMRLSVMKPQYLSSKPSIIINGFHAAGIVD